MTHLDHLVPMGCSGLRLCQRERRPFLSVTVGESSDTVTRSRTQTRGVNSGLSCHSIIIKRTKGWLLPSAEHSQTCPQWEDISGKHYVNITPLIYFNCVLPILLSIFYPCMYLCKHRSPMASLSCH